MKKKSVVCVVIDLILIIVKVKQRSESSQRFSFHRSGVKQTSEYSQCRQKSVLSVVKDFILIVLK